MVSLAEVYLTPSPEMYSKPSQISKTERFAKINSGCKSFTVTKKVTSQMFNWLLNMSVVENYNPLMSAPQNGQTHPYNSSATALAFALKGLR